MIRFQKMCNKYTQIKQTFKNIAKMAIKFKDDRMTVPRTGQVLWEQDQKKVMRIHEYK